MVQDVITIDSGKINEYLHHIDLKGYGKPRMLSVYLAEFDDCTVLLDCGTSLDIKKLIRYIKKQKISFNSIKYIITSHHHFDHNGGLHVLYNFLKRYNPDIKILTNQKTKDLLNNYEPHLDRAKRSYGDFIGTMKPIEENAFRLIKPTENPNNLDIFTANGEEVKLSILKTPGHVPDHQSPIFLKDNEIEFIFFGEAVGTIYHSKELVTMPVSMPIFYDHMEYMNTLERLKKLKLNKAGFAHFGVINGHENVMNILSEHESYMKLFKENIIKFSQEKNETRYIVNKIFPLLTCRTDLKLEHSTVFNGIVLGIVYGMMISLGLREIPEQEKQFYYQYS